MTPLSDNNDNNILILFIGWLSGILSTLVIEWIKQLISKRSIKKGIKNELTELQLYLVSVCYMVTSKNEGFTKEFVSWIRPYYLSVVDSEYNNYIRDKDIKEPSGFKKLNDEDFFNLLNITRLQKPESELKSSISVPKIISPYLDSKFNSLSSYSQKFQILVSKFRREIHLINSDIEKSWFYHAKSFDNISDNNSKSIDHNLTQIYSRLSQRTRNVIKLIDEIQKC